jgi:hypothetical protein
MRSSSTGSLVLTTLLAVVGWLAVTLHNNEARLDIRVQAMDLRLTTLEATQYKPEKLPVSTLFLLNSEVQHLEQDYYIFKDQVVEDLVDIDRRVNKLLIRSLSATDDIE